MKRGQASVEYLITLGLLIAALLPIMYYYFWHTETMTEDAMLASSEKLGNLLIDTAQEVYYSPDYAKRTLDLKVPSFVRSIYINNRSLLYFHLESGVNGSRDVLYVSDVPVSAYIKQDDIPGGHIIIEKRGDFVLLCSGECSCLVNETGNNCSNSMDDDCDGYEDCLDTDCAGVFPCP